MLSSALTPTEIQAAPLGYPPGAAFFRSVAAFGSALVGLFIVVEGLGGIPLDPIPRGSLVSGFLVVMGCFFLALGAFAYFWFGESVAKRATRVAVSARGIEFTRLDGGTVQAVWSDARLALTITNYHPGDPGVPLSLDCRSSDGAAFGSITRVGSTLIEGEAARSGLHIEAMTYGKPPREAAVVRIRHA
jgi:hypothetical protein